MDNQRLKAKAINELRPNSSFAIRDGVVEWLDKDQKKPSKKQIDDKILEIEAREKIECVQTSLMEVCDLKQEDAERAVLGYKFTAKQIERYKDKYERAKDGEFDSRTNDIIINKFERMKSAIRYHIDIIEMFREHVADLIEQGDLDKAKEMIEFGKTFDQKTTKERVQSMIGK